MTVTSVRMMIVTPPPAVSIPIIAPLVMILSTATVLTPAMEEAVSIQADPALRQSVTPARRQRRAALILRAHPALMTAFPAPVTSAMEQGLVYTKIFQMVHPVMMVYIAMVTTPVTTIVVLTTKAIPVQNLHLFVMKEMIDV